MMEKFEAAGVHGKTVRQIGNGVFLVLIVLGAFLFVKTISAIREYSYIGGGVPATNTISVSGEGDIYVTPDIATFSFSVIEEDKTVAAAQDTATKKMNTILALVKNAGVDDKDVQTTGYNITPQYDYVQTTACASGYCPPGRQVLRGYQVNQTVSVKVRDLTKAGDLLATIGSAGASNVSGLTFTIDNENVPKEAARKKAIQDAQNKAAVLARDLGVRLVRVVNFSENSGPIYYAKTLNAATGMGGSAESAPAPQIPAGQNHIVSNVTITYEIQ